eukprot:gene40011-48748_t
MDDPSSTFTEDQAQTFLNQPFEVLTKELPRTTVSIETLRQYADGCRLQGGSDQLDRALLIYSKVLELLTDQQFCAFNGEAWYRAELSSSRFGMGMVFASNEYFKSAEKYMLQGMRSLSHKDENDACQLLDMAISLAKEVYVALARKSKTAAPLNQAWHVLIKCACTVTVGGPTNLQDINSADVTDDDVRSSYAELMSSSFLLDFGRLAEARLVQLRRLLDTLHEVLVALNKHELAVQMYQDVVTTVVDKASSGVEQAVLTPLLLACARHSLRLCDEAAASSAAGWLDAAENQLSALGAASDGRAACELWGDLRRLRGDVVLALCLYAACFQAHGRGVNRDMQRLARKIGLLLDNRELAAAVPALSLPVSVLHMPFAAFLRRCGIVGDSGVLVLHRNLLAALEDSKAFSLDSDRVSGVSQQSQQSQQAAQRSAAPAPAAPRLPALPAASSGAPAQRGWRP